MRIRRSSPDRNFTVLPNATLQDERLSWAARGLLAEILSRPDGWECSADAMSARATATRGQRSGEGRRATRAMFAEIEEAGYMIRTKEHIPAGQPDGGRFVTVLTFYDAPTKVPIPVPRPDQGKETESPGRTDVPVTDRSVTGTSRERTEEQRTKEPTPSSAPPPTHPPRPRATPEGGGGDHRCLEEDADNPTLAQVFLEELLRGQRRPNAREQRQLLERVTAVLAEGWTGADLKVALGSRMDTAENYISVWITRLAPSKRAQLHDHLAREQTGDREATGGRRGYQAFRDPDPSDYDIPL